MLSLLVFGVCEWAAGLARDWLVSRSIGNLKIVKKNDAIFGRSNILKVFQRKSVECPPVKSQQFESLLLPVHARRRAG
jgi:hypothetical protein